MFSKRYSPAALEHGPGLLDADPPDAQHVLVRQLPEAAEGAVAELPPHLGGVVRLARRRLLLPGRQLDACEARPGEVLHPGGVARVRVELVDRRADTRRAPPVVQQDAVADGTLGGGRVPAVAVDEQDPAKALGPQRAGEVP